MHKSTLGGSGRVLKPLIGAGALWQVKMNILMPDILQEYFFNFLKSL